MEAVADTLRWLATVVAVLSLAMAIIDRVRAIKAAREKLHAAELSSFEAALASDDLNTLGRYLDEKIGAFDVSEYMNNREVADRVDRYVGRILVFLGTDEEVDEEERVARPGESTEAATLWLGEEPFPPPFDSILREVETGEVWNALAKLRRHLEVELRHIASRLGFKERHLRSAGQIVHLLADKVGVDRDSLERVRYAVSVSNRAIHGRVVSAAEAQEAVWNGAVGLRQLVDQFPSSNIILGRGE